MSEFIVYFLCVCTAYLIGIAHGMSIERRKKNESSDI